MTNLQDFAIDIYKLSNKVYSYQYTVNEAFFGLFAGSQLEKGDLVANVTLDKQETLMMARFVISGTLRLTCDRSLEEFDYPLHTEQTLIYQYGDEEEELTDEIVVITHHTQQINVAQPIYEFVALAVPMKRLHPKYAQDDQPFVDGEIVFSSQPQPEVDVASDTPADPRWEALKKLKKE
ncbi:MAG: DUF177 domain-containing protein [Tunicatimonas sp.]